VERPILSIPALPLLRGIQPHMYCRSALSAPFYLAQLKLGWFVYNKSATCPCS
jgi:hypothetical protein